MSLLREENFGIEYHMPFFGENMPPGLSRRPDETHKKKAMVGITWRPNSESCWTFGPNLTHFSNQY